jgi:hypothetical protein
MLKIRRFIPQRPSKFTLLIAYSFENAQNIAVLITKHPKKSKIT